MKVKANIGRAFKIMTPLGLLEFDDGGMCDVSHPDAKDYFRSHPDFSIVVEKAPSPKPVEKPAPAPEPELKPEASEVDAFGIPFPAAAEVQPAEEGKPEAPVEEAVKPAPKKSHHKAKPKK